MKERMQKTLAEVKGCPQKDRTESEGCSAANEGGCAPHFSAGIHQRGICHRQDCRTEELRRNQAELRRRVWIRMRLKNLLSGQEQS